MLGRGYGIRDTQEERREGLGGDITKHTVHLYKILKELVFKMGQGEFLGNPKSTYFIIATHSLTQLALHVGRTYLKC